MLQGKCYRCGVPNEATAFETITTMIIEHARQEASRNMWQSAIELEGKEFPKPDKSTGLKTG